MQFEICSDILALRGRVPNPVNVNAHLLQSRFQRNPVPIRPSPVGRNRLRPRKCRRSEQAAAKTRPLLIRPIHQSHSKRRFSVVFFRQIPHHLKSRNHAEASIQPAAVGNRVKMAAENKRLLARAPQRDPLISRGIEVSLHRKADQLAPKPFARLEPCGCKRNPLRPVSVGRQVAKLAQIRNYISWLKWHTIPPP